MGFFDRLTGKRPPAGAAAPEPAPGGAAAAAATPEPAPASAPAAGGVMQRLADAREKLADRDVPAALAIYEEVLAGAGQRADVLVTISGDLGSNGQVAAIIDLVAPRYDAQKHGPATGLNLLQAYLAMRDAAAAQHVLDILFSLNRPDLEERLHGFSNAIADLMAQPSAPQQTLSGDAPAALPKVALVSISKPMWFYGLEPMAAALLPAKEGKLRRVAFAQLALLDVHADPAAASRRPEDELARFSRGLPLWLAETFQFSPHYAPAAAAGLLDDPEAGKSYFAFTSEWTADNLQQLVDSTEGGLDYIFTGALRHNAGDFQLVLRVFEVKKFRERKAFTARWTPSTADEELVRLHREVCTFMEWSPEKTGLPHVAPSQPTAWIDLLGASLSLFLAEKQLLPKTQLAPLGPVLEQAAPLAMIRPAASLAWLTLHARAVRLGLEVAFPPAQLSSHPLVAEARAVLGT